MVINIIILYALLQMSINLLSKQKMNTLNCGIFVFFGNNPEDFNKDKFNLLGWANDERGGDAVGLFYDNKLYKSVTPFYYKDYVHTLTDFGKVTYPLVMGHTRKGSAGMGKTVEQAQPIVIIDKDKSPKITLIHNGTISNKVELAETYSISKPYVKTDTQVLTRIIAKGDYIDVLSEYKGTAALVWFNHKENSLYIYHGNSKQSVYGVAGVERPLFWLRENNHIYISSIRTALEVITEDKTKVESVPCNKVYKANSKELVEVATIDRSGVYSTPATTTDYTIYNTNNAYTTTDLRQSKDVMDLSLNTFKIMYYNGTYYYKGTAAHGEYFVDTAGVVSAKENDTYRKLSFYGGVLIIPGTFKELSDKIKATNVKFKSRISPIIDRYAVEPWQLDEDNVDNLEVHPNMGDCRLPTTEVLYKRTSNLSIIFFTGILEPFFTNKTYKMVSGSMKETIKRSSITLLTDSIYKDLLSLRTTEEDITTPIVEDSPAEDDDIVVCPCCEGNYDSYSTASNSYTCEVCKNTGVVSQEKYDEYEDALTAILEKEVKALEFTDVTLEHFLEITNLKKKLTYISDYMEEVEENLYEVEDAVGVTKRPVITSIIAAKREIVNKIKEFNKN